MTTIFRVLARQPLSISIDDGARLDLTIQGTRCTLSLRPVHQTPSEQRVEGGTLIGIEFTRDSGRGDLLIAAREGLELIDDFLSAVSVIEGATFRPVDLVQVGRLMDEGSSNCEFLQFLKLPANHWERAISVQTRNEVRGLLAHWDGLDKGYRLRRAARQYRHAIGNFDDVAAFLDAYVGLEAMEPALAAAAGLTPGTEETQGTCQQCGFLYAKKKTALVGVRAFALGTKNHADADRGRKTDWQLINKLRHDVVHSLVDDASADHRAHDALMATMHYLHDAICICSHASDPASPGFRLARGPHRYVLAGCFSTENWGPLEEWSEILATSQVKWVAHDQHGLVPEMSFYNPALEDLRAGIRYIEPPFASATMRSLRAVVVERD